MAEEEHRKLLKARELMDDFSRRTGLTGDEGDKNTRYLWTDAFAVQSFFGLSHGLGDESYRERALQLIALVHEKLGRFHPDDERKGWISGLSEEEGRKHPTAGGLRIGKKMPERGEAEPFHERLEWERDGQYFHYLTRWIQALLQAHQETGEQQYAVWAAELVLANKKFFHSETGRPGMYWKMSIDLSRPLVRSMGAHDPLEGLLCAESAQEAAPEKAPELELLIRSFIKLCQARDWSTSDSLGIGGLMLNTLRAAGLAKTTEVLPESIQPKKLFDDSLYGLKGFARLHEAHRPTYERLAFRECGLSLGLRALLGAKQQLSAKGLAPEQLDQYSYLADDIEGFWLKPENQKASTWTEHLDINAVSLAASLVAKEGALAFSGMRNVVE